MNDEMATKLAQELFDAADEDAFIARLRRG